MSYDANDSTMRDWFTAADNRASIAAKLAADARTRATGSPFLVDLSSAAILDATAGLGPAKPRTRGELEAWQQAFIDHYGDDDTFTILNRP
ncbi:hypothetical protein [Gordonia sihwensis]|uniref:hypothetical protein n=1 Tax=Gordonia sihwensis TaxID=173559 RepID=UPI003D97C425